jgi:hypothetical protein
MDISDLLGFAMIATLVMAFPMTEAASKGGDFGLSEDRRVADEKIPSICEEAITASAGNHSVQEQQSKLPEDYLGKEINLGFARIDE